MPSADWQSQGGAGIGSVRPSIIDSRSYLSCDNWGMRTAKRPESMLVHGTFYYAS